jgi:hypothetical protein
VAFSNLNHNEWLLLASVFVHFISTLLPRAQHPNVFRIFWFTSSNVPTHVPENYDGRRFGFERSDYSYPSPPEEYKTLQLPKSQSQSQLVILLDNVLTNALASRISSPSETLLRSPSRPKSRADRSAKFIPLAPEELLSGLGLQDVWPHWTLQSPENGLPWPRGCNCSVLLPSI